MATARYERQYAPQDTPRGVLGAALVDPLRDNILDDVEKFAEQSAIDRGREQATTAILSGENPSPAIGLTPGGRAYNKAAEDAFAARSEGVLRAKANELALQFDGKNPSDPESFAKVYGGIVQEVTSSVPERFRAPIAFEANLRATEAVNKIRGAAQQNAFHNDVAAINDGWKFDVQDAASAAQLGRHDLVDGALAKAEAKAASLVEMGVINQESAGLMMREGREDVAVETLYRGFLDGHVSPGAVQGGEVGSELSARSRDRLVNKMEAEIAHRRSEQNHAMAVSNHQIALGNRDLNGLTYKMDHGLPLTPEESARMNGYKAGLLPGAAVDIAQAAAAQNDYVEARSVATATPQQVEAVRASWLANPIDPASPTALEEALTREKLTARFDKREAWIRRDPTDYAMQAGIVEPVVLPPQTAGMEFDVALQKAAANVGIIRAQLGVDASPFSKDQEQRLAVSLAGMTPDEKVATFARIDQAFGPDASVVHEGLNKQGALVDAHVGLLVGGGQADLGTSIAQGQAALAAGNVSAPDKPKVSAALYASGVPSAFGYSQKAQEQIREAALSRAAYLATLSGNPVDVESHLPQAFKDVAPVGSFNGGTVALPPMTSETEFTDRVTSVTDTEIDRMAGGVGGMGQVADALRSGDAKLKSLGSGRYGVQIGQTWALLPNNTPFVLDYSKIEPKSPVVRRLTIAPDAMPSMPDPGGR